MNVDGGLVIQGFLDGMGSLLAVLGVAAFAGLALGCVLIYFEHIRKK